MQVKVLKNFGIVLFGALFGRGLFLIAQEGWLMTASVLDIAELSQIKNSGRDLAYKAEDGVFEIFGSEKLPTEWSLQIQLQYNPEQIKINHESLSGFLQTWTFDTGLVNLVLSGYGKNALDHNIFQLQFDGDEGQILIADAYLLNTKGEQLALSVGNLSEHHHHDE